MDIEIFIILIDKIWFSNVSNTLMVENILILGDDQILLMRFLKRIVRTNNKTKKHPFWMVKIIIYLNEYI